LAVARSRHDPASVVQCSEGRLTVLVGDPIVRVKGQAALWFIGSRREAVEDLLMAPGPVPWAEHLEGHFALLALDLSGRNGRLVTDLFSFIPVYQAMRVGYEGSGLVLGTHPDAVARAAGLAHQVDAVAAAELILSLRCSFPHTIYPGVVQLTPGTDRTFQPAGLGEPNHRYWQPAEGNPYRSPQEAAEELRAAVAESAKAACAGQPEVGLLLSGGEDSRVMLGAVPDGTRVRSFAYATLPETREVRMAARAARAHRSDFTVGVRPADDYLASFAPVARLVGSQHLLLDVHGYGLHDTLGLAELPLVLGGLSANVLFKGLYEPRPPSRARPVVPTLSGLRPDLGLAVAERKAAARQWMAGIRPATAAEWVGHYPFSLRKHGAALHGNRRLFRSHEVFHATRCLQVAAALPPEWKRGGWLFREAVRPILATTWWLPHVRGYWPYFGRGVNSVLKPGFVAGRILWTMGQGRSPRRQSPWPNWERVAAAPAAEQLRRAYPIATGPLAELFGEGTPAGIDAAVARWSALRRLMVLQLAVLLGETCAVPPPAERSRMLAAVSS